MKLFRSGEDYLKTILILQSRKESVRSTDVADHLHVTRASVCRAMKLLQEGGFLTMDREKRLHLTPLGKAAAESVYEKHSILCKALLMIGVTPETAEKDACGMEHAASDKSIAALREQLKNSQGDLP